MREKVLMTQIEGLTEKNRELKGQLSQQTSRMQQIQKESAQHVLDIEVMETKIAT